VPRASGSEARRITLITTRSFEAAGLNDPPRAATSLAVQARSLMRSRRWRLVGGRPAVWDALYGFRARF
ncbi:MAG: hypothetical protein WCB74_19285, partial [Pseudolabrys sp.]